MVRRAVAAPSPNFDARPMATPVDILLLHYTGMETDAAAVARLCDPDAKVSAHYTVDEDGTIFTHVPEDCRAWHAGVSYWAGARDINARSIGIEIVNPGHEFGYRSFPGVQVEAVIRLVQDVFSRHPIPPERAFGYGLKPEMNVPAETVIEAFQRHYRPARIDGIADKDCEAILAALLHEI